MDQTTLIDDEPNKVFQNPKWTKLFLNNSVDVSYQKKGVMVRPCILVVVDVERFTLCKDDLSPFHSHYAILEVIVEFSISILFLVQIV